MTTNWVVDQPEFRIGYQVVFDKVWMHCDIHAEMFAKSVYKRLLAAWDSVVDRMKAHDVGVIYVLLPPDVPQHSKTVVKHGGFQQIHESMGRLYFARRV